MKHYQLVFFLLFSLAATITYGAVVCTSSQYSSGNACADYSSTTEKASALRDGSIDSGNTSWILTATVLVMLMAPATGIFYSGLYKAEHAMNTIFLSFLSLAVISTVWILFGYSFVYSSGSKGYGDFNWSVYKNLGAQPSGVYANKIPHILYAVFQNMFAGVTPAFLSGAVVGRMKFGTYFVYITVWTLVVYNCLAHWVWGSHINPDTWLSAPLGWLAIRGTIDFAGGSVIHIASGFAALATSIFLGKRDDYRKEPVKPHNTPIAAIGMLLLWAGWFGYTGGRGGAADGIAAFAVVNTQVAGSVGMICWVILEALIDKRATFAGGAFGTLAGLVAITPAAGYVWPWHALIFGVFSAIFGFLFSKLKYLLRYDDPFDVFAIHGICGCVGMFMTGLFATNDVNPEVIGSAFYGYRMQLVYQLAGIAVAASFSFACTSLILILLKLTVGIRVERTVEEMGLDRRYHGGSAYNFNDAAFEKLEKRKTSASKSEQENYLATPVITEGRERKDEDREIYSRITTEGNLRKDGEFKSEHHHHDPLTTERRVVNEDVGPKTSFEQNRIEVVRRASREGLNSNN